MAIAFVFPLLDTFFAILWFFLFILWIWLVISVLGDVFASPDLGGLAKGLWVLAIVFFPLIGVFAYVLMRGAGMSLRRSERARRAEHELRGWIDQTRREWGTSVADEVEKLAGLRDRGVITEEEFNRQKERLLR